MRYAYIDGAALVYAIEALREALQVANVPFDHGSFINQIGAERAFYYDSIPAKKPKQSDEEYRRSRETKEKFFSELNLVPKMFVRTGTSKYGKDTGLGQKGVDVMLAVDAITHAYSRVNTHAILVVNDLDFFPVMNALLLTQVRTTLMYRPQSTSRELKEFADNSVRLGLLDLLKACEPNWAAKYFPTAVANSFPLSEGERKGTEVKLLWGNEYAIWQTAENEWTMYASGSRFKSCSKVLLAEHCLGANAKLVLGDEP